MTSFSRFIATLCAAFLGWSAVSSGAPRAEQNIKIGSRKTGSFSDDQNPELLKPKTINVAKLKLRRLNLFDAQYGTSRIFMGISLIDLVAKYKSQAHDDLMILHFENGMNVPLTSQEAKALEAFVALKICSPKGECDALFPEIDKNEAYLVTSDPRPIKFSWNKLVVNSLAHPDVPAARSKLFSPWHHVNSLVQIEFVNREAYYKQFDLGEREGERVYRERCQFCHSARYVGAQYGWDFVTPLPIYEKRSPDSLLNHVKYPKARAREMGLMMPNQKDVSPEDIRAIWSWMKAAATAKKMPDYRP